jgi:DNA repair protein RadC
MEAGMSGTAECGKKDPVSPDYRALQALLAAIIQGSGASAAAERVLTEYGAKLDLLQEGDLYGIPGIGEAKRRALVGAIDLHKKLARMGCEERPVISSPSAAAALLQAEMQSYEQEHLKVILLDARNRLIRVVDLYTGSLTSCQIRIGELFRDAIKRNAAGVILVHNHHSGDPSPSPEDLAVTRNAVEAGKLLDIPVLDHIVIGRGSFLSLREQGVWGKD